MPEIVLHHCPGALSQATLCSLAMEGLPYRLGL